MADDNNLTKQGIILECEDSVEETEIIPSSEVIPFIHPQLLNMIENMNANIGFLSGRMRRLEKSRSRGHSSRSRSARSRSRNRDRSRSVSPSLSSKDVRVRDRSRYSHSSSKSKSKKVQSRTQRELSFSPDPWDDRPSCSRSLVKRDLNTSLK